MVSPNTTGDPSEQSPTRRSMRASISKESSVSEMRNPSKMSVASMESEGPYSEGEELDGSRMERRRSSTASGFGGGRRRSSMGRRRSSRRNSRMPTNEVKMHRMVLPPEAFYGKLKRDPTKGTFRLHEGRQEHMDFHFVDLFTRDTVEGTPEEMAMDPYIFRPKLMHCRSWVYQELHDHVESGGEGMLIMSIQDRLSTTITHKCNDRLPTGGPGMWSPVMYLAPMMFIVAFTADFALMFICFVCLVMQINTSKACNSFKTYKYNRPITIIMRLILGIYIIGLSDIGGRIAKQEYLQAMSLIVCLLLVLNDYIQGDVALVLGLQSEVCYKIERLLPGKVMVCRRIVGTTGSLNKYEACSYAPLVVGEEASGDDIVLMAEIQGLLFELVPMDKSHEWHTVLGMSRRRGRHFKLEYYGTSTFTDQNKHADAFDVFGVPKHNALTGSLSSIDMLRACADAERVEASRRLTESPKKKMTIMAKRNSTTTSRNSITSMRKSIGLKTAKEIREELQEANCEKLIGLELMDRQINKIAQTEYAKQTREMKDESGHHVEGTEGHSKAQHLRRADARGTNLLAPNMKQQLEILKKVEHDADEKEAHAREGHVLETMIGGSHAIGDSSFTTESVRLEKLEHAHH